jgi:hypothetical protein
MLDAAPPSGHSDSEVCRSCHPDEFARQSKSEHARALALASAGSPGHWAFGAGIKATTYVSQITPDQYLEHGLTYYAATKSMALTPGHTSSEGLRYRTFDPGASILRCFRCHSTGTLLLEAALSVQPPEAGVHCESCHGPGAAHVESQGAKGTIRNPGNLFGGLPTLTGEERQLGITYSWSCAPRRHPHRARLKAEFKCGRITSSKSHSRIPGWSSSSLDRNSLRKGWDHRRHFHSQWRDNVCPAASLFVLNP